MVFTVFEKAQSSKVWYLLCFRKLSLRKHTIYYVLEGSANKECYLNVFESSAEQSILFTMFSKLPKVHNMAETRARAQSMCQTSCGSSCLDKPRAGVMSGAKPRAKYAIYDVFEASEGPRCGWMLSGSVIDAPNLERELLFGAKPRARAHVWSLTSRGSAGFLTTALYLLCFQGSADQSLHFRTFTFHVVTFHLKQLEQPNTQYIYIYIYIYKNPVHHCGHMWPCRLIYT